MKRRIVWGIGVGLLAAALIGCPQPTDEDSSSSGYFKDSLKLNGKVYKSDGFTDYTENRTIIATGNAAIPIGGTGKIANKDLSFVIEKPTALAPLTDTSFPLKYYTGGLKPSGGSNVNFATLHLTTENSKLLTKQRLTQNPSIKYETVMYVYVSANVTLTGKGTSVSDADTIANSGNTYTVVSSDVTLNLKQGWNELYTIVEYKNSGSRYSIKISDPSDLRWLVSK
jgi:hypothetical protein